jgi:hypothetical protein
MSRCPQVRTDVQKVFGAGGGVDRVYFPEKSSQIPDRPALTLCVLHPDSTAGAAGTTKLIAQMTSESGTSGRTFKSALVWSVAEDGTALAEEARKLLAWKDIESDSDELKLDEPQVWRLRHGERVQSSSSGMPKLPAPVGMCRSSRMASCCFRGCARTRRAPVTSPRASVSIYSELDGWRMPPKPDGCRLCDSPK